MAVIQDGLAGAQGDARGVDKTAAITGNAVGVGHDHLGRLPRHFGIAAQLAGAAAADFVEDDVGSIAMQVRVAEDDAAQLCRLGAVGGVVEDQAIGTDVVIIELVMRQPAAIGCCNIDDRDAITRCLQTGAWPADDDTFGLHQQWLPEHRVGQNKGQATPGHAQEGFSGLQGRGGLASQKGQVTVVHVSFSIQRSVELKKEIHTEVDRRFTLGEHIRSLQGMSQGHTGAEVAAPGKQLQRIAGDPAMYLAVVTPVANHALVVAKAGAVIGKYRAQPPPRHRTPPAQVIAPVTSAVAGQLLVLVSPYRGCTAQA